MSRPSSISLTILCTVSLIQFCNGNVAAQIPDKPKDVMPKAGSPAPGRPKPTDDPYADVLKDLNEEYRVKRLAIERKRKQKVAVAAKAAIDAAMAKAGSSRKDLRLVQHKYLETDLLIRTCEAQVIHDLARTIRMLQRKAPTKTLVNSHDPLDFLPSEYANSVSPTPTMWTKVFLARSWPIFSLESAEKKKMVERLKPVRKKFKQQLEKAGCAVPKLPTCEICKGLGSVPTYYKSSDPSLPPRYDHGVCSCCDGTGVHGMGPNYSGAAAVAPSNGSAELTTNALSFSWVIFLGAVLLLVVGFLLGGILRETHTNRRNPPARAENVS